VPPRAPLRLALWVFRLGCIGAALAPAGALRAQSLLDRPPNFAGAWVVRPGTVQFNFLHRFVRSDAPERKVSSFPTFVLATGIVPRVSAGFTYATNSQLVPGYPNEWEFFGRYAPLQEDAGQPLDVTAQAGYNLAAEGVDGEVALGRRLGPVRALAALRLLSGPEREDAGGGDGGDLRAALAGGATIRLHRYVAIAADVATLLDRDDELGEEVAWSAGLHLAIPNSPHTLSLQAANTNTATLQGASRGTDRTRYGFEFTIPVTLARYFGRRAQATPADTTGGKIAAVEDSTPAVTVPLQEVRIPIRNMAFARTRVEVPAGTTIVWENADPLGHTATSDSPPGEPGGFDSGNIEPGGRWRHTFTRAGTYAYHCTPHPFMKATIVVR
jgi:plastocyanin